MNRDIGCQRGTIAGRAAALGIRISAAQTHLIFSGDTMTSKRNAYGWVLPGYCGLAATSTWTS